MVSPQSQPANTQKTDGQVSPEILHVVVGHSAVVSTESRVKRMLTGNPAVIESVLTSPNEVVVTAKDAGGSSLVLWEEAGKKRVLEVFADIDVESLRDAVKQTFPNTPVEVQSERGKVILVGTVANAAVADQIAKMGANFSKEVVNALQVLDAPKPARLKQVVLKVRFAEADRAKLTAFGVNLLSTGGANTIGTVTTQQFGGLCLGRTAFRPRVEPRPALQLSLTSQTS